MTHYLVLAALLFLTGMTGFVVRRNAIVMLMCVELMLCSVNIVFAVFARATADMGGHVFILMNFAIAAAEAAIGLALLVEIFRRRRTVNVDDLKALME
ncbi:MAG TPA: NADH-quinone oxidoreductase subunit NuoK [Candidatus Krumholzibacteria bacterium]|nr:NADH-quinone oxidoreductase subunit NuoK [Candidatus Krumholzibacteria bacterium]